MRDPKTHAKVLAQRTDAVLEALHTADVGSQRWVRLVILSSQVWHKREAHRHRTGAAHPPRGRHTTIIPDTEEDA